MSGRASIKVIIDTNIWISFLIGKRLQNIKDLILAQQIAIVLSEQLLLELKMVTQRPKLKKYFQEQKVDKLIEFLRAIGQIHEPSVSNLLSRDPKDNFLLDLAETSKADFLVTGDKDLLDLNPFKKTQIVTPADFEVQMEKASR
jgi:putative PIN family toxin of toxin-antitoxin system